MYGAPPNCRPECILNSDCPSNRACIRNSCEDPCAGGSCGINARCEVVGHNPVCNCMDHFEGDPYAGCNPERGKCFCLNFLYNFVDINLFCAKVS